jgi:hypothetical protein
MLLLLLCTSTSSLSRRGDVATVTALVGPPPGRHGRGKAPSGPFFVQISLQLHSQDRGGHAGATPPRRSLVTGEIAVDRPLLGRRPEQGASWPCWAGLVDWARQGECARGEREERGTPMYQLGQVGLEGERGVR